MPAYKSHTVISVARGLKAFLTLGAGVTRGEVPDTGAPASKEQRQRIQQLEKQLADKDRRIARLESDLGRGEPPVQPGGVLRSSVALPPKNVRPSGKKLRDDEFYLSSARTEAAHLAENLGLTTESSLLDVGSGPGRIAIGILEEIGGIRKYRGVDVSEKAIQWGQRHITPHHPGFQFVHVNAENTRYNPDGTKVDQDFALPFSEEEFDIICAYSLFSHMLADEVRVYLKDFQRMLRPGGSMLLTAFLEDGVPDVTENPEGYKNRDWSGPLHCVRYNREFFEAMLEENGLRLDGFDTTRGKFQRRVYVSRKD